MEINERHRTYRRKGWEYILNEEDHTACIKKGRIGRCRRFRVYDHIEVDGVRYTITKIEMLSTRWSKTLRHINIPDSVTYVEDYLFSEFLFLRSVYLGKGVESLNQSHFALNPYFRNLYLSQDNPNIRIQNDLIVSADGKEVLCGLKNRVSYDIPYGVRTIGRMAFKGKHRLERVALPESLETIGKDAFAFDENLRRIILPEGVRSIGNFAFKICENLEYVELPSFLRDVGWNIFYDCTRLKSLVLRSMFDKNKNEDVSIADAFSDLPEDCTIYVPYNLVEDYRDHGFWGRFSIRICQVGGRYDCDYAGPLDTEPEGDLPDMIEQLHHAFAEFRDLRKVHPSASKYLKTRIENGLEITYHDLDQWRKDEPDSEVFVLFDAFIRLRDAIDLKIMHLNRRGAISQ